VETAPATYWLATVRPDGRPHVMPILAVWVNGMLFFAAGQGTRKARNLVLNSHCVVAVEQEPLDLVIEGSARKTRDDETLRRVAERYATIGTSTSRCSVPWSNSSWPTGPSSWPS
jgi:flavin reductase (DIM6/NTAB) family NADH-FMN oxidoreductase RutF